MPLLGRWALILVVLAATLAVPLRSQLVFSSVGKRVVGKNNKDCFSVPGLEACEDAKFVGKDSDFAYLACSTIAQRALWTPAALKLDALSLPPVSSDHVAVFDLSSRSYTKVGLIGLPVEAGGIWVHGMDIYRDPLEAKKLTLFLISHQPPEDRASASRVDADSVVEIFETEVGARQARWIKTGRHELVKTRNAVAATSSRTFYVTNDHNSKTRSEHWSRPFGDIWPLPTSIAYCDASGDTTECMAAADKLVFPNGLAIHGNLVYHTSSKKGTIGVWQAQQDHSLQLLDTIQLGATLDNILVGSDGAIYAPTYPKLFEILKVASSSGASEASPAVEVWKITSETDTVPWHASFVCYLSLLA